MRSVTRIPGTVPELKRHLGEIKKFSASLLNVKSNVRIDNLIITLHSTITVQILMIGTIFVSMRQYFGDPIDCLTKDSDIKASLIEHYCWIEGSFSVVSSGESTATSAYPGVSPTTAASLKRHHKYYQWVYFVLIIQSIMFYLPKFLWRATESGRLKDLISKLSGKSVAEMDEKSRITLVQEVADNLSISHNYLTTVILCEVYCLIHLAVQIWFTDIFLGGAFYSLGLRWLSYANHYSAEDPLISIFPRMVKCSFHKFGFSGTMETKDALCFLPLNIVNEKIYAILWIWFAILTAVTVFHLTLQTIYLSFRPLRVFRVRWLAPGCNQSFVRGICKKNGHWLVLGFLANNMKPSNFRDLLAFLERDHFDGKGRPLHVSRVGESLKSQKAQKNACKGVTVTLPAKSNKYGKKGLSNNSLTPSYAVSHGPSSAMGVSNKQQNLSCYLRANNEPPGPGFVVAKVAPDWNPNYTWNEPHETNENTKLNSNANECFANDRWSDDQHSSGSDEDDESYGNRGSVNQLHQHQEAGLDGWEN